MVKFAREMTTAALVCVAAMAVIPAVRAYGDFDGLSTDELENILSAIDYAGGDYREVEPSQPDYPEYYENDYMYPMGEDLSAGDYADLVQEVPIQQRQQEILDHGTPISGADLLIGASGGGGPTKGSPPKNSGAVLPAYCDPPNPCPIGYTAKDGCIEDFENTSEFSREYQARQNCLCDSEHMFNCPAAAAPGGGTGGERDPSGDQSFLAGYPPGLGSELDANPALGHKLVAKKGLGF